MPPSTATRAIRVLQCQYWPPSRFQHQHSSASRSTQIPHRTNISSQQGNGSRCPCALQQVHEVQSQEPPMAQSGSFCSFVSYLALLDSYLATGRSLTCCSQQRSRLYAAVCPSASLWLRHLHRRPKGLPGEYRIATCNLLLPSLLAPSPSPGRPWLT